MFFYSPLFLLLLLIPFGFFLHFLREDDDPFKKIMPKEIREKLFLPAKVFSSKTKYMLFILAISLCIIALARPVKIQPSLDISQTNPSVVLAIDMSKSMKRTDIFPTRAAFAKAKAAAFIAKAQTYNIALLFYANDAYMIYPLSQENDLLLSLLKDANITQQFAPNSNLFAPLQAGNFLLQNHQNRHLILLSDGGKDILRKEELDFLRANDIALSAVAITPKKNHALQTLSKKSAGLYQAFTYSDSDISAILRHIDKSEKRVQKKHLDIPQYDEYFSYPLALSMLLLALLFLPLRMMLLLFCITLQPAPMHAGMFDFWQIYEAQKQTTQQHYKVAIKRYKRVKPTPKIEYNLAYALYKDAQYHEAIKHYKKALGISTEMDAKVYYNIATAYARENKLDFAKKFYAKSLALAPTKHTQENLRTITQALKKERRNRHKAYEKIHFKAIGNDPSQNINPFSHYTIKLHNLMPSEEERWFQKIAKDHAPTYLQKINTDKRSIDANISW